MPVPGPTGWPRGVARLRRALRRGARVASPGNPLAVAQLELLSVVEPQQRALTVAVPAIDALARAIDRLAYTPPADQDPR